MLSTTAPNYDGREMTSLEWIVVHDTAGGAPTHTAESFALNQVQANNNPTNTYISWHFTVGTDGIFQSLPLDEVAYHAGDGTGTPFYWTNSNVTATENVAQPAATAQPTVQVQTQAPQATASVAQSTAVAQPTTATTTTVTTAQASAQPVTQTTVAAAPTVATTTTAQPVAASAVTAKAPAATTTVTTTTAPAVWSFLAIVSVVRLTSWPHTVQ